MQLIKLKPELFDLVRSGKKTATTRKGHKDIRLGKAEFVNPSDDTQRMSIEVIAVQHISFNEFFFSASDFLYPKEGYESRDEFIKVVTDIYGYIDLEEEMTIIYFKYMG